IELVPKTAWGDNLRSRFKASEWDALRHASYARAGHKCEICGGVGKKHPVECHEIWTYDDATHVQTLHGLISLCPNCHEVKHFGRARVTGNEARAFAHLVKVNDWTDRQARDHINEAFSTWQRRSQHPWTLDISLVHFPE
ncbi:MAG: HNH endonuclease, partial [Actinobacteria bacterium]|nr:HNH endonuclease [Actinomycetota bacterium]